MNFSPNTMCRCSVVDTKCLLTIGLVLFSGLAGQCVSAQQINSGVLRASKDVPAASAAPRDALSDDPRLDVKVTLTRRQTTVGEALQELSTLTKVAMAADGRESQLEAAALSVEEEPLRDVLRSLAKLNGLEWKRTTTQDGRQALLLGEANDSHQWDFLAPSSQSDADEHKAVQDFQNQAASLPPQMQQALAVPHRGVPFADLPVGMQQTVRDALTARNATLAALFAGTPIRTPITSDNVDSQWVVFTADRHDGLTEYKLDVRSDGLGSVGMGTTVPDDLQARNLPNTLAAPGQPQYQDVRHQALQASFDQSREKAKKEDTRLSQMVSVKIGDCALGFVLTDLSHQTHVNIVAQVFDETHTVSLGPIPLKDALDQITAKYHEAWAETADGTVLVGLYVSDHTQDQKTAAK